MLALRAGLNAGEPHFDARFDGLVIAQLEMQEGDVFHRAPVAAIERVAADEVQRARNGRFVFIGQIPEALACAYSRECGRKNRAPR